MIDPTPPNTTIDAAPITHMFRSPADVLDEIAERYRDSYPEIVPLADEVADLLDRYGSGEITLVQFGACHTPYQRFCAVRSWGPSNPHFQRIMPVLDDLIALQKYDANDGEPF